MKLRMFFGQLIIEMKLFLRDRQAVFWTFFFPVFLVLLFGYIFSKPDSIKFGVGVVDEDQSEESQELVSALEDFPVLKLEKNSRETILKKLNDNDQNIAIIINKGYAESLNDGGAQIELLYDQAQQQTSRIVVMILQQLVDKMNLSYLNVKPPIEIVQKPMKPEVGDLRYIDFLLPGVIGMSVVSTCLFSIGMVVVAYREKGKLRRLSVTPLPKPIFIAGQMVNRYFIVLLQAFLLIAIGMLLFKVRMVGNFVDFLSALTVGMLAFIAIGFFIASVANTTETASGIANTLFLPMIFLSGVYFSVEGLPKFLKPLVEFLPLTHLVRAIRAIFNHGLSFFDVLPQMGILSVWTIVGFAVSVKLFKWE
ncbi:ABC transporter permease [candidate division KSB1 bacterium]|nr:ABC transporter permease [candidate division KSB1 bacterium]NIR69649.1 ABC transporter permease [candidate division KSB1 bacterium]NIS22878.1 ABC transporter permease [candidate division KSB1 bacterium]NIT69716.1 ABC transporter permease [candidate division KSB1 bacterium]NIU23384.1 ABC transporter permease [candidate division KSB1 bacterium]